MSLDEDYQHSKKKLFSNRTVVISHQQRLNIYGLFRQAETGDCGPLDPKVKTNVIAYQKWLSHNKLKGMSTDEAKRKYVDLVAGLLDLSKSKPAPPPPILPPFNFSRGNSSLPQLLPPGSGRIDKVKPQVKKSDIKGDRNSVSSVASTKDSEVGVPELPQVNKPTIANEDKNSRAKIFRSRNFSSVAGLTNPLTGDGDVERKYEIYEKLRAFYAKFEPERVKKGLGNIVEWTMEHGEKKLNLNLKKKYGKDLNDMEKFQSQRLSNQRLAEQKRRTTQMMLSRRFLANTDPGTRKKMDKLTRFLLVNDPELVSRGMYLMVKFIEAKGLGALNENLKRNYGKSLDGVTEEELNQELMSKYGNDLDMLKNPLFTDGTGPSTPEEDDARSVLQQTLKEQIRNIDHEKLKSTQLEHAEQARKTRATNAASAHKPSGTGRVSGRSFKENKSSRGKQPLGPKGRSSVEKEYMETLSSKPRFLEDFHQYEGLLQKFLEKYEPYRYDEALKLMSGFMKKNGVKELNKKLTKKYDVDLDTFQTLQARVDADMTDEEFQLTLLQFVNKHEAKKNIERAIKAMTEYRRRHGIAALNTKLYMKYGETLVDFSPSGASTRETPALSMAEMTEALPSDLKTKLKSYYAKYDPMMLGDSGVDKIFEWAERNGQKALDKQLKVKYKESLSDFIASEKKLKFELEEFYKVVDRKKVGSSQVDSVLAWAMLNGRDALNYNLRKKYDADLDSVLRGSKTKWNRDSRVDL